MPPEDEGTPNDEAHAPGSPEDVAARLAAQEAADADEEGSPDESGSTDGEPPEGDEAPEQVSIDAAELARLKVSERKLKRIKREQRKAKHDGKPAEEAAEAAAPESGAAADDARTQALEQDRLAERKRRETAEARLRKQGVRMALRDEADERGWGTDAAKLASKLLDVDSLEFDDDGEPTEESLSDAIEELTEEYASLFSDQEPESNGKGKGKRRERRPARRTPAEPDKNTAPFEGYVSPEEYATTPHAIRMTDAFQARVEKSRAFYPDSVPRDTFAERR